VFDPLHKSGTATAVARAAISLTSPESGTQTCQASDKTSRGTSGLSYYAVAAQQRDAAIKRASFFRDGNRTIDSHGREATHASISIAKRYSRTVGGLGLCVAQRRGEDLFPVMRKRIADAEEARRRADEEEAAKGTA
jgi:hypothetical protein